MSEERTDLHIDDETRQRQRDASDPERSVWVTANAGSGKTFVLSRRVIRLLLAGADPGSVLCLTFTKAAAAQMQAKVFEVLAAWTQLPVHELREALADLLGRAASEREMQLARQLFARAIETPGRLKIQTIHAFCESVLQRFAFEARVPAGFRILDDDMARAIKTQARQDVVSNPDSEALAETIGRLSLHLNPDQFASLLEMFTDRRHEFTHWRVNERFSRGTVRQRLAELLDVSPGLDTAKARADILGNALLPRSEWESIADALDHHSRNGSGNAVNQLRAAAAATNDDAAIDAYMSVFFTDGGRGTPRKNLLLKAQAQGEPGLADRFEREGERLLECRRLLRSALVLDLNADLAEAADAVIARYERAKRERGLLDYADLIAHTVALLEYGDDAAWVLYKLDPGLDHILVDEAQDTSRTSGGSCGR